MQTEGQTDVTKLIVTFRNFGKAPHEELRSLTALI